MPLKTHIDQATDWCRLAQTWLISNELAQRLVEMTRRLPFGLWIYSGYRSPEDQQQLVNDPEKTAAAVDLSTHTTCPATGADITPDVEATRAIKAEMGAVAIQVGLRWGGGAPVDDVGIPVGAEWHHVDLGPRRN